MFPFEVRGQRVAVRDFVETDRESFVRWAADDEIYRYMQFRFDGRAAAEAEFARLLGHPTRIDIPRRHYYLAVLAVDPSEDVFAGITGLETGRDGRGEFGWYLMSALWGQGLASETTLLLLELGFDRLGLSLMSATCDPANGASRRVLEKAGLKLIGEAAKPVETWNGPRRRLEFVIEAQAWRASRVHVES